MRTRRVVPFAAAVLLCTAAAPARAGDGRVEVDLFAGAAFGSHSAGQSLSSVDEFGTRTSDAVKNEAKTSLSYGASLRYVDAKGFGVEILFERARLGLDSTTTYDLAWDSVIGPRSESFRFGGSGKLEVDPLSLNLLYGTELAPGMRVRISGGFTYERIDYSDLTKIGLVTYVGDSIETFAGDARSVEKTWKATWNAGMDLDFRVAERLSVFIDFRYYGEGGAKVRGRHVETGTYAGLHLGGTVHVDAQEAAEYDARIGGASYTADIQTKMPRAAVGLRYRF